MIETWVGLECTVNRVGDRFHDQVDRTGHSVRVSDIDRIASLGVGRLRYPVLWERMAPNCPNDRQWYRVDAHLARVRELGLAPIAGLTHHGSGPAYTNLLDPRFPELLARYAGDVAARYPWIDAWTPVNEPMVTARFAGLYGHWYPHHHSDQSFVRMVMHQALAIVLSMQAIRRINPTAEYVHTEDGGTVFSAPSLSYQADFENNRRDVLLDLLYGRVTAEHPQWEYLRRHGATESELAFFADAPVVPDVIGIDYYASSDRYLDHRLSNHPIESLGGNGAHRYADVSASHGMSGWRLGFGRALRRTYARYRTPVALTEVHLGCTREEQLRWLHAAWEAARDAEDAGVEVRAVTTWSLFGAFDWDRLVTTERGHYEPGAFDVRSSPPRQTAIARAVTSLASSGCMTHPVLAQRGWWEQHVRPKTSPGAQKPRHQPVLILGAGGTLGSAFVRHCQQRGLAHLALTRVDVDIREPLEVRRAIAAARPWAVINAAGFVNVDAAEHAVEDCLRTNALGAEYVADACARNGAQLLTFSTDLVFDGNQSTPYLEQHETRPLGAYGRSKAIAEHAVRACLPEALVVRTSAFFGPWDNANFVTSAMRAFARGGTVPACANMISPTYVPALVDAALDLLIDREGGVWHLSNRGAMSWCTFARFVAEQAGYDPELVDQHTPEGMGWIAVRPEYSVLGSERGSLMPTVEESLHQYLRSPQAHMVRARASERPETR